jgi:Holliday junction resolvasome RuvABC endonuclease subunit
VPLKILALDLGTDTGVAHNLNGSLEAHTLKLATAKEITSWGKQRLTRRNDERIHRFAAFLKSLPAPDAVVWEDVNFSSYTSQVQLWSSYRTTVWLAFGKSCLLECVPVGTLKKFATGNGGADKAMMEAALFRQYPEWKGRGLNDDALDALFLWLWAEKTFARLKS